MTVLANLHAKGKVRDIYEVDGDHLLMVASDRISAFDVVLPNPIPDKGRVLTGLSLFWFDRTRDLVSNHVVSASADDLPPGFAEHREELAGRSMLVRRARMIPIECVARGYLSGSGWKEYRSTGRVCGIPLPEGLVESDRLPEPIFTPATKAETGHDENISLERAGEIVGEGLAHRLEELTIALYELGAEMARGRGVILADTKFEFGLDPAGELVLGDEVCTPDSSRFWPADEYEPGRPQPSFDKQFVRDWASSTGWDKTPPAPAIPDDVVEQTRERYVRAYEILAGEPFDAWLQRTAA
jgi:phosphoribosylaminoimidazole-succinocarboxamide synthase